MREYQCPNCRMPRRFDVATKLENVTIIEVTYECESKLKVIYPKGEYEWVWECKNWGPDRIIDVKRKR